MRVRSFRILFGIAAGLLIKIPDLFAETAVYSCDARALRYRKIILSARGGQGRVMKNPGRRLGALIFLHAVAVPAAAGESTVYTYDGLGRLVAVTVSGGPNDGQQT